MTVWAVVTAFVGFLQIQHEEGKEVEKKTLSITSAFCAISLCFFCVRGDCFAQRTPC